MRDWKLFCFLVTLPLMALGMMAAEAIEALRCGGCP